MKNTKISRRRFLRLTAAGGALAAVPGTGLASVFLDNANSSDRVLVSIHLRGGNDGLNTVIPLDHPVYLESRPGLKITAADALPLGEGLGWHPSLTGLRDLYDEGVVALVNGVGYPAFDRSHFRASDIYWGADPVGTPDTGWLGRCLDQLAPQTALGGAFLGNSVPLLMTAATQVVPAFTSAENYSYMLPAIPEEDPLQIDTFRAISEQGPIGEPFFDALAQQNLAALDSSALVALAASYQSPIVYPEDDFAQQMRLAAQLIHGDFGTVAVALELGGFDTHSDQIAPHAALLAQLSAALSAFVADADVGGFADRVLVVVFSEFGRRVAQNGSLGTDHGTAGPMLVIGAPVLGGLYGAYPDLDRLDSGDLRMTTDFREVYATLIGPWFGLDSSAILGGHWTPLPFLA